MIATIPCILASVYFFGWRSLALVLVSCLVAFITEYLFLLKRRELVSEAVFVTGILYALILPPTTPWHVVIIGIVFAILFAKMVFGGFGKNVFNPAMSGRAFVYICFPVAMTARWAPPAMGIWGALGTWSTALFPDAISSATPLALAKAGHTILTLQELIIGRIAGSMGVTSVVAILLGGMYLIITKTANRWLTATVILVYGLSNGILAVIGTPGAVGLLPAILGGGFLFGAFFMITDPVTAPKSRGAQLLFAALVGIAAAIIRTFSVFNGGFMFALLLGNMFAPILDYVFKSKRRKKAAPQRTPLSS